MPILSEHDVLKTRGETVDQRHNLGSARNREAPPRTEIILNVHHDQDIALADGNLLRHVGFRSRSIRRRSNSAVRPINASPTCTGYISPGSSLRSGSGRRSSSLSA